MDIARLEAERADAAAASKRAGEAFRDGTTPAAVAEYGAANERLLGAERALADARGQEYAAACAGFPAWDIGAPLPHLASNGSKTVLVYFVRDPSPSDGRSVRVADAQRAARVVAVVRFRRVVSVRMGAPNDEVIEGHPLHGRGLAPYEAHLVMRSSWIDALRQINSVHRGYDASWWSKLHHYLLAFHDETFECIAEDFTVTTAPSSLATAFRSAVDELME